jgi:hypothetical protein
MESHQILWLLLALLCVAENSQIAHQTDYFDQDITLKVIYDRNMQISGLINWFPLNLV